MEVDISASTTAVVIGATGLEEIYQNVRTIITTPKGSVPLDREFGVDQTFLDMPTMAAMTRALPAIVDAVEKYEPRVKVTAVNWIESDVMDGRMIPQVRIRIRDGY